MMRGRLAALAAMAMMVAAAPYPRDGRDIYFGLTDTVQSCASCHGIAGQGGSEGGTVIPEIQSMFEPGRRYADAARLCRALVAGTAHDGRKLAQSMPRYTLSGADCEELTRYMSVRDERIAPGVDDARIMVRLSPAPVTSAHRRWRDVLIERFDAVNRNGGVYGRRIDLSEGGGAATFLIALEPLDGTADADDADAAVRIALRDRGVDPATRGVEANVEAEMIALLTHLRGEGAGRVTWIDDAGIGPGPDELRLLAIDEGLDIRDRDGCRLPTAGTVVILSAVAPLPAACANAEQLFVSLRGVTIGTLPQMLESRPAGRSIHVFASQPLDGAFSVAPALLADIIVDTSRRMTARPTALRVLSAFDVAWRLTAEDAQTLYSGVALQRLMWPTMRADGHPVWKQNLR